MMVLLAVAVAAVGSEVASSSSRSPGTPRSLAEAKDSVAAAPKDGSSAPAPAAKPEDTKDSSAAAAPTKSDGAHAKAAKPVIPTGLGHGDPDPTAVWRESPKQANIAAKVAFRA